jgi:hypothetical protein
MQASFNFNPAAERVISFESGRVKYGTARGEISAYINFTEEIILKTGFTKRIFILSF